MNTDTPTQESLDEIKKQIAQAIEEKEGDFIALAEQIEQIENEAMEKFDKDCAALDAWFAEESTKANEDDQQHLQDKYRSSLADLGANVKKEMEQKFTAIYAELIKKNV